MATDVEDIVERAYFRVVPTLSKNNRSLFRLEIESMVDAALTRIGDNVADGPDFPVLQKLFSGITVSGGAAALPDALVSRSIFSKGTVLAAGDTFFAQFLPSLQDLQLGGRPADFHYYTIRGNAKDGTLFLYNGDGTVSTAASVTIRANYYPAQSAGSLSDLPSQLKEDLIDILVGFCKEKVGTTDAVTRQAGSNG